MAFCKSAAVAAAVLAVFATVAAQSRPPRPCASCDRGKRFAAVALDEGERCAGSPDLWPCLRTGGARVVAAVVGYPGEIPLLGQYLSVVPAAAEDEGSRNEGRGSAVTGTGNGTSSSSVYSKLQDFAAGRMLRVSVPLNLLAWLAGVTTTTTTTTTNATGRGKKDKGAGVLMLGGMMMITTLMSTAFGALALMAAKGLLTSILALMLSAMAVAKKSGGHGHARTTYAVVNGAAGVQAMPAGFQDVTDYKLEDGATAAVVSDLNNGVQYQAPQTEPIQYGNQQYD